MSGARTLIGISVFWLGLSALGDGFAALVVPARVAELGDRDRLATEIGLVTFVALIAGALIQPAAGALSDRLRSRLGRKPLLLGGTVLVVAGLALFGSTQSLFTLLVAFVLLQVAANIAQSAQQGYIPDLVASDWRGRAAGLKGLADVGGAFIAFLVLGILIEAGPGLPLVFVAGAVVVTAGLAVLLIQEPVAAPAPTPRIDSRSEDPPSGGGPFARLVVARFLFLLGIFGIGRFMLLLVADRLAVEPDKAADETGAVLAGLTLVTAIASPAFGWLTDRLGRRGVMLAGSLLGPAGAVLLMTAADLSAFLMAGLVLALASAAFVTANWAWTTDVVPARGAGRLMGIANLGTAGAAAGAGLLGPLGDAADAIVPGSRFPALLGVAAVAMAAAGIVAAAIPEQVTTRAHDAPRRMQPIPESTEEAI